MSEASEPEVPVSAAPGDTAEGALCCDATPARRASPAGRCGPRKAATDALAVACACRQPVAKPAVKTAPLKAATSAGSPKDYVMSAVAEIKALAAGVDKKRFEAVRRPARCALRASRPA